MSDSAPPDDPPEVEVRPARGISSLWLIPLVAAVIGAWLVYRHFSEQGPMITLTFETASGLEAGRTPIKYKDVEVGRVQQVALSEDLSRIEVTARMDKDIAGHLNQGTRFWVVRPRVDTTGVSGLNTLISGAYIAMEPGDGEPRYHFQGLEEPPITPADTPGLHLILTADSAGSIGVGSPVYYKRLAVGRVEDRKLDFEDGRFEFSIFIEAPYNRLINSNTRFWNASGISLSLNAEGFQVRTESLEALVLGGITFENIATTAPSQPVADGTLFTLYPDRNSIRDAAFAEKQYFVLHFQDSVRGLKPGAPVEYRGVRLGQVSDVSLVYDPQRDALSLPVLIELELERLTQGRSTDQSAMAALQALVRQGLRAQLAIGSLLTGQLYIALDIHPDAPAAEIVQQQPYPELPTVASPLDQITSSATRILAKIEDLPLEALLQSATGLVGQLQGWLQAEDTRQLPANLNRTLGDIQRLTRNLDEQIDRTAKQLRGTLAGSDTLLSSVGPDSPLYYELTRTLRELTQATRRVRDLAEQLKDDPQSLLFGKD